MSNINRIDFEREFFLNQRKKYYEKFREFKSFKGSNKSRSDFYVEHFKKQIEIDNKDKYYYNLLIRLNEYIQNGNFSLGESVSILVNFIDPNLEMLLIYESLCNKKEIEKSIREKFGFYDNALIKIERMYARKYKNIDDYSFEKNLVLKIK